MPEQYTRADSLYEYLTGTSVDGAAQPDPSLSKGNHRSSTEAVSLGILINNPISGVVIQYAGGGNPVGTGTLIAVDANNLKWKAPGASDFGPPANFPILSTTRVVESEEAGQYLRIYGSPPFSLGSSSVVLSYLMDNVFGMNDVASADASAGVSDYRATIVRNESTGTVSNFKRWIALLGTTQTCTVALPGGTVSGTLQTGGSFIDWPSTGWCQVRSSGGILKEVVYYTSRTNTVLTVPGGARALLGTVATAGTVGDVLYSVPGIAIALDPSGLQAFGSFIQSVGSGAPAGVTWSLEITETTGLSVPAILPFQQFGVWMWRQMPAGSIATPSALTKVLDSFSSF
jgi:hypothetical protein